MITPNPTRALPSLHIDSDPKAKTAQLPLSLLSLSFSAPCFIPAEFQVATAMTAANQKILMGQCQRLWSELVC